ncbi:MAG: TetR/AcrR family transcriptional regulator [Elusimicrobiaceae bacterium]|jgi:AcrR family transcriptional regulator
MNETEANSPQIRAQLLKAAFELIAEKGIEKVSVREIVERVNVSKPVLYYYFKDKEDLCSQLYAQTIEHMKEMYTCIENQSPNFRGILVSFIEHRLCELHREPKSAQFLLRAMGTDRETPLGKLMYDLYVTGRDFVLEKFRLAEERGEIRKGSGPYVAFTLHSCHLHILTLFAFGEQHMLTQDFAEKYADFILEGAKP